MSKPTTDECVDRLNEAIKDAEEKESDFVYRLETEWLKDIRAKLLAAEFMAEVLFKIRKPWPHEIAQLDEMADKALVDYRAAGGQ